MPPLDFFKALADDTRLNLLMLMYQLNELCVCELSSALALSQPKISRHLAILREAISTSKRQVGLLSIISRNTPLASRCN